MTLTSKAKRDLGSVKVWLILLTTVLLYQRRIGAEHWTAIACAVAGARELSNLRHSWFRNEDQDH